MCGFRRQRDATDQTLDRNTGSEGIFQKQEKVRDDITQLII